MRFIYLILCLIIAGCVSVEKMENNAVVFNPSKIISKLTNLEHVHIGMTMDEVKSIMGQEVKIGYKKTVDDVIDNYEPIFMKNPFRAEVLQWKDEKYDILYYFTFIKKADNMISDDELTPFVFFNKKLIGKDWDFLFKLREKINT